MKQRLLSFMQGRYGNDELNYILLVLSVVLNMLSGVWNMFASLGMVCLCYAVFRMLSRNIYQRRAENAKVVPYVSFVKAKISDKGKNRIILCHKCKRTLRIPKGKGKVVISCPCGNSIKRKS